MSDAEELRERYAKALRGSYPSNDTRPSYRAADAVFAVRDEEMERLRDERDALKAAVKEIADDWRTIIDSGVMAGSDWESCLMANEPRLRRALDGAPLTEKRKGGTGPEGRVPPVRASDDTPPGGCRP